jgi:hypothetical protein
MKPNAALLLILCSCASRPLMVKPARPYCDKPEVTSRFGPLDTPVSRPGARGVLLKDGRVLRIGGGTVGARAENGAYPTNALEPVSDTSILEPSASASVSPTDAWHSTTPLPEPRSQSTATLLESGKVLVVGGRGASGSKHSSALLFDPATEKWTSTSPPRFAHLEHTATALADGRVLVMGGGTAPEVYDPVTGAWQQAASSQFAHFHHTATLLSDGRVLVVGGTDLHELVPSELYEPTLNRWTPAGGALRWHHAAITLGNGRVLVTGGGSGGSQARVALRTTEHPPRTETKGA